MKHPRPAARSQAGTTPTDKSHVRHSLAERYLGNVCTNIDFKDFTLFFLFPSPKFSTRDFYCHGRKSSAGERRVSRPPRLQISAVIASFARSLCKKSQKAEGRKILGEITKVLALTRSPLPPARPIPDPIKRCRVLKQTCAVGVGGGGGGQRGRWRGRTRRERRRANRRPIIGKGRD